jgi:hypothetical protein
VAWKTNKPARGGPASGIPAGGPGLHGPASGKPAREYSAEHQAPPEAKSAGHLTRAEFRERLAEKLEAVAQVYDNALKDPDPRVALVAAKQVSVELWGQPTQAVTGEGGGPLTVVLRRFTDAPEPDA